MGGKRKPKKFNFDRYPNTVDQLLGKKLDTAAKHLKGFFPEIAIDHTIDYAVGSLVLFMESAVDSVPIRDQARKSQRYARSLIGADLVDLDFGSVEGKLQMVYSVRLSDPMVRVRGEVKALKLLDSTHFIPMHRRAFENLIKKLYKIRYNNKPFEMAEKVKELFESEVVVELQERNDPEICNKLLYIVFPELKNKDLKVLSQLDAARVKEGL